MKTKTKNPDFKPQFSGVLKFPKGYKQQLIDSEDKDYIKLSEMEGKRIAIMKVAHIGLPEIVPNVNICEPFEGSLSLSLFIDVQEL